MLNLISDHLIKLLQMTITTSHGGTRAGAGRKPGEPTQPIRVPESQVTAVVDFLAAYRDRRTQEDEGVRLALPRRAAPGPHRPRVRLMGYCVPAGFPSPADDYVEEVIDLNTHLIMQGHEACTFVVKAEGWSMIGCGIHDGDELMVDRGISAADGHVVVAAINGELLVKRLRHRGGKVLLVSENPHYPERVVAHGETLEIWGVVTRVLHKL
jgi:DNA polymerase V